VPNINYGAPIALVPAVCTCTYLA